MNLTNCELCRQQVSPLATNCPACGHPMPAPKPSAWYKLTMQVPSLFFGLVFVVTGLGCGAFFSLAFIIFTNAKSAIHEQLAVQLGILSAISALIAVFAAWAADRR